MPFSKNFRREKIEVRREVSQKFLLLFIFESNQLLHTGFTSTKHRLSFRDGAYTATATAMTNMIIGHC